MSAFFPRSPSYFWGPIPWMIEIAALLSAAVQHWADFAIIVVMLLLNAGVGFLAGIQGRHCDRRAEAALGAQGPGAARWALAGRARARTRARRRGSDPARQHRSGRRSPRRGRLSERRSVRLDRRVAAGREESRRCGLFGLGRQARRDEGGGDRDRHGAPISARPRALCRAPEPSRTFSARSCASAISSSSARSALSALILTVALFRGDPLVETLLFALILTVAAIPVALPAVLSVTMAVGAEHLARLKAIVSRLVAIEELAGHRRAVRRQDRYADAEQAHARRAGGDRAPTYAMICSWPQRSPRGTKAPMRSTRRSSTRLGSSDALWTRL